MITKVKKLGEIKKEWEERSNSEIPEEIVYGKFLGDRVFKSIEKEKLEKYAERSTKKMVNSLDIKEGMLVLDAGVGPLARVTIPFASKKSRVIAIDISSGNLNSAKKKLEEKKIENVHLIQADIMNLPFKKGIFDVTFCIGTIFHMPDKNGVKRGINEFARVTNDKGIIFFDLDNYLSPINWQWIIGLSFLNASGYTIPHHFYNYYSVINIIQSLNPKFVEIKTQFGLVPLLTPLFLIKPFSAIAFQITKMWDPINMWLSEKADKNAILRVIGVNWLIKIRKWI